VLPQRRAGFNKFAPKRFDTRRHFRHDVSLRGGRAHRPEAKAAMAEKMRLVCPNCSAQYEVDASAIPASGRDVQCSNCGHTWWQRRETAPLRVASPATSGGPPESPAPGPAPSARSEPGPGIPEAPEPGPAASAGTEPGPGIPEAPAPEPVAETEPWSGAPPHAGTPEAPAPEPVPEAAPPQAMATAVAAPRGDGTGEATAAEQPALAGSARARAGDGDEDGDGDEGPGRRPQDPALAARRRRTLDEAVLDVLREEAEREARARQSDGAAAVPHDAAAATLAATLGRGEGEREAAVRERLDAIGGIEDTARVRANQRLPDVEEINSTLEGRVAVAPPPSEEVVAEDPTRARRRTGFRLGFILTLLAAIGLLLAYVFADAIVAQVPSLEPGMTRFTESMDAGRLWLHGAAVTATEAIRAMTRAE
jgi:predicted Zn finger-like uncharacterized protein